MTAILATIGAMFAYMGGATQANAGLFKNDAAIKKTEASNQWNYYQAKSSKQNLAELARDLAPTDKQASIRPRSSATRRKRPRSRPRPQARGRSQRWDEQSDEQMHQHHRWAQATTALQISIALAAIALLTKKKWLEWGMFGVGGVGVAIGALAVLHI